MLQHAAHRKDTWHFLIKKRFHRIPFFKGLRKKVCKACLFIRYVYAIIQKCFSYAWSLIKTSAFSLKGKNTIPIYLSAKHPRIGTILKNHIQSSLCLFRTALFVCSESDTSLMNCSISGAICVNNLFWHIEIIFHIFLKRRMSRKFILIMCENLSFSPMHSHVFFNFSYNCQQPCNFSIVV